MRLTLFAFVLALSPLLAYGADPVSEYQIEEEFNYVKEDLKAAIQGQGLLVSGELHVQEMLVRTAADLGFDASPYLQAESIEFCSAYVSHLMIQAHPVNATICPFTIALYVLAEEPDIVHVAYRNPVLVGDGASRDQAEAAIDEMMTTIVNEALGLD